jgi:two-component system chemotaxis response regulator CheB
MTRVLIVDDSSFMRKALSIMVDRADGMTVAGTAANGREGVEKARSLEPDVVTMDVEMPELDGITAVRKIMSQAPCPILMVSSRTEKGAATTMEAMQAGAADFIPKGDAHSSLRIRDVEEALVEKIQALAGSSARLFNEGPPEVRSASPPSTSSSRTGQASSGGAPSAPELIVIGVSTGGPLALQHVLPRLPAKLPAPVAVAQHMPPQFTRSLAERLDDLSALTVREASDGMPLTPGRAVVAAGGRHLTFEKRRSRLVARTPETPTDVPHCPSVDVMFKSACAAYGGAVLALVMTGMGTDGREGARRIKSAGGTVLAQGKDSCVVYGMPRAVVEDGLADAVWPLEELSEAVGEAAGTPALS